MKDALTSIGIVILGVFGFLSTVCSAIVAKYTPIITLVVVVLEIIDVTNYGVWTVIGYGLLTCIAALFVILMNMLALAVFTLK